MTQDRDPAEFAGLAATVDAAVDGIDGVRTRPRGRSLGRIGAGLSGRDPVPNAVVERAEGRWRIAVDVAIAGHSAPAAAALVAEVVAGLPGLRGGEDGTPEVTVRIVDVAEGLFSAG
ncbi:hypothetical protein [Mycetocola reblochoni]|uniref:Uncharacterized protein n=2 Tax=Mycetocola reblochoni TaxID=331618 RepID=A0A1R4IP00_9MICO|nr:hypothetical protein [Mycetocola reblochoni]RLP67895.1 hypothetical protein D9V30_12210 [Mycetocola reblochoni]SJN21365.1 hypothetical protein FM119_02755 [Mycetocola reblochoni REB411]